MDTIADPARQPIELNERIMPLWETLRTQLGQLLELGGPVIIVLLALSVVALMIIFVKWWQFATLRIHSDNLAFRALSLWHSGQADSALELLNYRRQPVVRVLKVAMSGLYQRNINLDLLREEITRTASAQLENLRSHLRALEVIATLSPLLGLLGTVIGMIEAFKQLEAAGSQVDPAILSGGIWQALLTTAVGLSIAIPVVLIHTWFERRVERCEHLIEDTVTRLFTQNLYVQARTTATAYAA